MPTAWNNLSILQRVALNGPRQYQPLAAGQRVLQSNPPQLTQQQNHAHVLKLYRKIVRSVPRILMAYEITGGPTIARDAVRNVRSHFEHNRSVRDPGVVAALRHKCEMELSETLMLWKTKSHVCNIVLNVPTMPLAQLMQQQQAEKNLPKQALQSNFLSSFYQG